MDWQSSNLVDQRILIFIKVFYDFPYFYRKNYFILFSKTYEDKRKEILMNGYFKYFS